MIISPVLFGDAAAASAFQQYKANNYHHHLIDDAGFCKNNRFLRIFQSLRQVQPRKYDARNFSGSGDSVFISRIVRCVCF